MNTVLMDTPSCSKGACRCTVGFYSDVPEVRGEAVGPPDSCAEDSCRALPFVQEASPLGAFPQEVRERRGEEGAGGEAEGETDVRGCRCCTHC